MGNYSSAEQRAEWQRGYRARNSALIDALKDNPCSDCGETYPPYVMQFDHLDGKRFALSRARNQSWSVETILAEVAKCELVCANCHAERTYQRSLDA